MDEISQWVLTQSEQSRIPYLLADRELMIQTYSPEILNWVANPQAALSGQALPDVFPQLVGVESHLGELAGDPAGKFLIQKIHQPLPDQPQRYFDLSIQGMAAFGAELLVLVKPVSDQARLEQQLIQQRNELRLQISARERVEEALRLINLELESRVLERTAALSTANERLRALSRRLVALQETERRQIARELHDEIGQVLTGLKLLLGMSLRGPAESSAASLTEAQTMVNDLMGRVRQLSLDLRPAMLDDLGLLPALLWHFERYTTRTRVQVDFRQTGLDQRFDPDLETAAYRIIQEALTNVARYAAVDRVRVRAWTEASQLHLEVEDQGPGFDVEAALAAGTSNGLSGMRERAGLLDGQLEIEACPGQGTRIFASLPLENRERKPS